MKLEIKNILLFSSLQDIYSNLIIKGITKLTNYIKFFIFFMIITR